MIAIVGVGRTKFGELFEKQPEELIEEAGLMALESAGVEKKELKACFLADYFLPLTNKIGVEEGMLAEMLGTNIPMEKFRSFNGALANAANALELKKYDVVLVGGLEKMTDRLDKIRDDLMILEDPWSFHTGATPEANHELLAKEYMKPLSAEERNKFLHALGWISVKNHGNALKNEYAHFRRKINLEDVLKARSKGRVLGMYDFAPISDGATALIATRPELADCFEEKIYLVASGSATDYLSYHAREERNSLRAVKLACATALHQLKNLIGETPDRLLNKIKIVETYDQSTLLELLSLEDLGFVERGKAWKIVFESLEGINKFPAPYKTEAGEIYFNTNGGLKADGNPLGATGGAQVFEIFRQLTGKAGEMQVDTEYALSLELEGFGTKAYVNIFSKA
ncbi:MAG: hypothetical protein QW507_02925 [Candidatus Nanoarchaeia archaeon]|nr:hypothetical protein [Candidatus Haiyanarchaeum thermophilum]MCW1303068.1 hypothetical protein [Candidatus Haiyanarchaeum thermophilum]MCW1303733.1 hypothetical protein [Candidatus Haiyanarchaeum thermophilum]MCW1306822.1 hypothetical protein [Candidatus Haiyanarchaeum thermophilum]MCW1307064.1 hypothetical protein [Candidatus Haiyanarchaeum thermophilum]